MAIGVGSRIRYGQEWIVREDVFPLPIRTLTGFGVDQPLLNGGLDVLLDVGQLGFIVAGHVQPELNRVFSYP